MLRTSIIVTLLSLLGALTSFVNQLVLATLFGATVQMDAYLIATSVPLFLSGTLIAVLSYSMVPTLVIHKSDPTKYKDFGGLMLLTVLVLSVLVTLFGFFASPQLVSELGKSLSPSLNSEAVLMARVSWSAAAFALIAGYLGAMHNAAHRFITPVIATILPYVGMVGFSLAFGRAWGLVAVTYGMLAGSLAATFMLLRYCVEDIRISKISLQAWPWVSQYVSTVPLVLAAMMCFTIYQSIDAYWAPKLGPANLAFLGYAQRLVIALGTLIVAGPSAVLVPRLTEAFTQRKFAEFFSNIGHVVRTVIAVAALLAMNIALLSRPIVKLVFERGAFDQHATTGVASILPLMMFGMIPMLCVVILFRAFFAKQDFLAPALLGGSSAAVYFLLSGVLSSILSVKGIALAYAITWWILMLVSLGTLYRGNIQLLLSTENLKFTLQLGVSLFTTGTVIGASSYMLVNGTTAEQFINLVLQVAIPIFLGFVAFYVMTVMLFKMPDIRIVTDFFLARLRWSSK